LLIRVETVQAGRTEEASVAQAVALDFGTTIALRIEESRQQLASRWLEELKRVVPVAENEIFPGDELLGQIPALIQELASFLKAPAQDAIAANAVVTARATELGHLRHAQHASLHQVLREYRALRATVSAFIKEEIGRVGLAPSVADVIDLLDRFESVIDVLLRTTVDTFVAEYTDTITQHASRLEGFNRMVTHELRQPLGVLTFGVKLLRSVDSAGAGRRRDHILATVERNVSRLDETLKKLVALSRSAGSDNGQLQHVNLGVMVTDIVAGLRDTTDPRGVRVEIGTDLPTLTIDAGRLELVLANLISNAIKYSDPDKLERFVLVENAPVSRPDTRAIAVRDNGIGIDDADLRSIFGRFYRGHPERDGELGTSGLGLGLSIVADCVDALKGDIHVESVLGEGTTFFIDIPITTQS
jgi:signal transduction histidine kinase